jgi:hypothetical protein
MEPKYYDYRKSPSNCYNLFRDNRIILKGVSEQAAWQWLLANTSASVGHNLAWEGYKLISCEQLAN